MAAAKYDIIIDEGQNLNLDVTWFDSNDNAIDITGYGAYVVFKEEKTEAATVLLEADETDYIVVGTTDGKFVISIPGSETEDFGAQRGYWMLVVYATAGDITDNPVRLLEGRFKVSSDMVSP